MSYFDLTIDGKLAQADAYYAADNHIRHMDWERNSSATQKAGLNQAEREVNLYLGTDLADIYGDDDFPVVGAENFRPDFAIFEHALFILENTARTHAANSGARDIESVDYQEEERTSGVTMSPQATRFLQLTRSQLDRG